MKLKTQLGSSAPRTVTTISNTGALDGMTNQCFWISILHYLQRNGHPQLTLAELRSDAGLNADTEHIMFNVDYLVDGMAIFFNAAVQITEIYNLRIQVYTANRSGEIKSPRGLIGEGENLVEIAQFGFAHFELIDTHGEEFVPAVLIKQELKKIDTLNKDIIHVYLSFNENYDNISIFTKLLKEMEEQYKTLLTHKEQIKSSSQYSSDEKSIFLTEQDQEINKLVSEMRNLDKQINNLKKDNESYKMLIDEHEKSLS